MCHYSEKKEEDWKLPYSNTGTVGGLPIKPQSFTIRCRSDIRHQYKQGDGADLSK